MKERNSEEGARAREAFCPNSQPPQCLPWASDQQLLLEHWPELQPLSSGSQDVTPFIHFMLGRVHRVPGPDSMGFLLSQAQA